MCTRTMFRAKKMHNENNENDRTALEKKLAPFKGILK